MSTRYTYTCQTCGKVFTSRNSPGCKRVPKYCSYTCMGQSLRGKPSATKGSKRGPAWNRGQWVKFTCEICSRPFEVPKRAAATTRYCSRACANEAKRRVTGPDHPLWTKVQRTCEWCGEIAWVKPAKLHEFRFCSRRCLGSATAAKMAERNGPTSIEKAIMDELDRRGIMYHPQYQIGAWMVDIAIPAHRVVIECDGNYWHASEKQKAKDANKDHWLHAHKWTIFRFSESAIHHSPVVCIDAVMEHIAGLAPHQLRIVW